MPKYKLKNNVKAYQINRENLNKFRGDGFRVAKDDDGRFIVTIYREPGLYTEGYESEGDWIVWEQVGPSALTKEEFHEQFEEVK